MDCAADNSCPCRASHATTADDIDATCASLANLNRPSPPVHQYASQQCSATNCTPSTVGRRIGRGQVDSGLTHECGVFGAIACGEWPTQMDIAQIVCLGLVALQHRGQESAGIVTSLGQCAKNFNVHKGMGLISNIFNDEAIKKLRGNVGIGHTRYSTSAASEEVNCQPFVVHTAHGVMAVAHNGELVNCESLRRNVLERGVGLSTHSDSELITQALCLNPPEGEVSVSGVSALEQLVLLGLCKSLSTCVQ